MKGLMYDGPDPSEIAYETMKYCEERIAKYLIKRAQAIGMSSEQRTILECAYLIGDGHWRKETT